MYTFVRWVRTVENRSAFLAVRRVAECLCAGRPCRDANPLFLHGPAGTGKTHLVSALAAEVARHRPDLVAVVVPSDELDVRGDESGGSHPRLADADLLVVEDLQHLPERACEAVVQA